MVTLCVCTWFDGGHHGSGGLQHGFINGSLVSGELAVGREGAGDVGGVAVILSAHVKQTVRKQSDGFTKIFPFDQI